MMTTTDFSDNREILKRIRDGDENAREQFIKKNLSLVRSIAKRFIGRGHDMEDITEIGTIGLLKAVDGFDENQGYSFSTYAFPLITGEIKRFLRDDGIVKVSRNLKKNAYTVLKAKEDYTKIHGTEPRISELCEICSLSGEEILQALEASSPVMSLQDKISADSDLTIADTVRDTDKIGDITEKMALKEAIAELDDFEKQLIELRYYREFTQVNTAKVLGVSQVTVSRSEKKILEKLRKEIM